MNHPTKEWVKSEPTTSTGAAPRQNRPQPAHTIRFGHIKAAVWRNESATGVHFNTTFSKIYRDGEQWKRTDSFGRDDLLLLAKTADAVHSWIFAQSAGEEGEAPASRGPQRNQRAEARRD